jgi:hypothetical protein
MHLTGLDLLFWAAGLGAHLALLTVLLIRRRYRDFPIFTTFILVNILRTLALYFVGVRGSRATYFYTFWSLGILDTMLQISVIYEMYAITFRPAGVWASDVKEAIQGLAAVTIVVAAALTWLAAPPVRLWVQVVVIRGNFFSSACMSALFVGMIALSVKTGRPWKTHVARISQGFGIYSMLDLLVEAGHSYFGVLRDVRTYTALSHVRMIAYLGCVGFWTVMLWRDAPVLRRMPEHMLDLLTRLQSVADSDLERIRVRK